MKISKNVIVIIICGIVCFLLIILNLDKNKKQMQQPRNILNLLNKISSSNCSINIKIFNDKQVIEYSGKQIYKKAKEYKIQLDNDKEISYNYNKMYVIDKKNNVSYIMNENCEYIYKLSFVDEYIKKIYMGNKVKYKVKNIDGTKYLLINLKITEMNRNMNNAIMYIDCKNVCPKKIIIYDIHDKQKIEILYQNYEACSF